MAKPFRYRSGDEILLDPGVDDKDWISVRHNRRVVGVIERRGTRSQRRWRAYNVYGAVLVEAVTQREAIGALVPGFWRDGGARVILEAARAATKKEEGSQP